MQRRITEAALCLVLCLVGVGLIIATPALIAGYNAADPYYAKSAFFPWIALGLIAVFGALGAAQAYRGIERVDSDEIDAGDSSIALALGGALLFALLVPLSLLLGYAAATWLVLLILGRIVGIGLKANVVIASALALVLYLIFVKGFKVWFPLSWVQRMLE